MLNVNNPRRKNKSLLLTVTISYNILFEEGDNLSL